MMGDETKIPKMMELLFGEVPEPFGLGINSGASERLKRWCQAFEEWLVDRKQNFRPGAYKKAVLTWRRLLGELWTENVQSKLRKMPWELEQEDIEQHRTWMEAKGYAPTTIYNAVGILASFYRYCGQRQVDAECGASFNPAERARRPKIQRYAGAKLLSPGEVERLLGMMRRDETPLGKRDYAFTLARLRLVAPLSNLQQLRWGQIEQEGGGVCPASGVQVRWRPEAGRVHLDEEAWEAMRAWLKASGRLEGMREGTFVFTPLRHPGKAETGREAKDWEEERCLSSSQLLGNLKLYGRLAGIAEEKLTLMALRRTAVRLRMEAGRRDEEGKRGEENEKHKEHKEHKKPEECKKLNEHEKLGNHEKPMDDNKLTEIQAFLDSQEGARFTKYRLKWLPPLPEEAGEAGRRKERRRRCRCARPGLSSRGRG